MRKMKLASCMKAREDVENEYECGWNCRIELGLDSVLIPPQPALYTR